MNDLHEKIASAMDALTDVMSARSMSSIKAQTAKNPSKMPTAAGVLAPGSDQIRAARQNEKKAEDESLGNAYRRVTGEELPDEVAENPAARAAVEKLAASALRVNDLGEPSDRPDPSARREIRGGTREERAKQAYEMFGADLLARGR